MKAASELKIELNGKGKAKIIAFILANQDLFSTFHAGIMVGAESLREHGVTAVSAAALRRQRAVANLHLPLSSGDGPIAAAILAG
mgnify:CR=1 FL=1